MVVCRKSRVEYFSQTFGSLKWKYTEAASSGGIIPTYLIDEFHSRGNYLENQISHFQNGNCIEMNRQFAPHISSLANWIKPVFFDRMVELKVRTFHPIDVSTNSISSILRAPPKKADIFVNVICYRSIFWFSGARSVEIVSCKPWSSPNHFGNW